MPSIVFTQDIGPLCYNLALFYLVLPDRLEMVSRLGALCSHSQYGLSGVCIANDKVISPHL